MYKLNFGECKHHIHGNAPMDFLHSLNLGIFNYALETLYGKDSLSQYCTDGDRYILDQLSITIGSHCKHQSDRTFERTNFIFGITAMSKIKGQEKSGVLLIILISFIISDGTTFWKNTKRDQINIKKWILLIESILCFEQWVYLPTFKKKRHEFIPGTNQKFNETLQTCDKQTNRKWS